MKRKLNIIMVRIVLGVVMLTYISSCSMSYSFSGASISPDVKSVSVDHFQNLAPLVNPTLSNTLSEGLRNRFVSQTRLNVVPSYGDLSFSGEIRNYRVQPVAIQGNEVAAMNRLTIAVRVKFENAIDPSQNYDRTFTHFEDFDSRQQLVQVEQELVRLIVDKLVEDIFNSAVANW
ncbi:MAG: LPS assembly lipoprotein LptE [Tenuifilaceae bacterium]|nr:LPS assembly lipoprotein LptE [Tenuifilaceae bacterium]